MDSVTDKFSVFDFFNLLIGGFVFYLGLAMCNYSNTVELWIELSSQLGNVDFLPIIITVLLIACSLITGMVINEIGYWVLYTVLKHEDKIFKNCLNKSGLIKNEIKLQRYREKAKKYLNLQNMSDDRDFSHKECSAFFGHCIYYIHVRDKDKKTEKLREVKGLSELLAFVFFLIPIISIILYFVTQNLDLINGAVALLYVLFICFGCAFLARWKRALDNRIKMVLAVYDACSDMNSSGS